MNGFDVNNFKFYRRKLYPHGDKEKAGKLYSVFINQWREECNKQKNIMNEIKLKVSARCIRSKFLGTCKTFSCSKFKKNKGQHLLDLILALWKLQRIHYYTNISLHKLCLVHYMEWFEYSLVVVNILVPYMYTVPNPMMHPLAMQMVCHYSQMDCSYTMHHLKLSFHSRMDYSNNHFRTLVMCPMSIDIRDRIHRLTVGSYV